MCKSVWALSTRGGLFRPLGIPSSPAVGHGGGAAALLHSQADDRFGRELRCWTPADLLALDVAYHPLPRLSVHSQVHPALPVLLPHLDQAVVGRHLAALAHLAPH